jgi:hypothetical protein
MSARKHIQTEAVGGEVAPKQIKALGTDTCRFIVQEGISPTFDLTTVVLRRVFFVNE